jgi:hypothetical protein
MICYIRLIIIILRTSISIYDQTNSSQWGRINPAFNERGYSKYDRNVSNYERKTVAVLTEHELFKTDFMPAPCFLLKLEYITSRDI